MSKEDSGGGDPSITIRRTGGGEVHSRTFSRKSMRRTNEALLGWWVGFWEGSGGKGGLVQTG